MVAPAPAAVVHVGEILTGEVSFIGAGVVEWYRGEGRAGAWQEVREEEEPRCGRAVAAAATLDFECAGRLWREGGCKTSETDKGGGIAGWCECLQVRQGRGCDDRVEKQRVRVEEQRECESASVVSVQ
jgi:hypothetical protein